MNSKWLSSALEKSRALGFLGPNAIEPHIEHARGFVECWDSVRDYAPTEFLDLGSGGGLPGLVLLEEWQCAGVLTDSMEKRMVFLREVLEWPEAPTGGHVVTARAEDLARDPDYEEAFDLVTARSFGPPAVTAECAVRFLKVGGLLIVSEPPDDAQIDRWPTEGLEKLGLTSLGRVRFGAAYQILEKASPTPPVYPRPSGTPKKNPLF